MHENPRWSRRAALRRAAMLAATFLTSTVVPNNAAHAQQTQQKVSKAQMKYQDKPNGDMQCGNCMHFVPPSSCKIVEGTVSSQGYCIAWAKKG